MEAPFREEARLRERILDLAARGEEPPADLVAARAQARQRCAGELKRLPAAEARRVLGEELDGVEDDLRRLEEGSYGDPKAAYRRALELGEHLRWLLWLGDVLAAEPSVDPLTLVEAELHRLEEAALTLSRLEPRLEARAAVVERRARRWRALLFQCRLERFLRAPPAGGEGPLETASAAWLGVTESFHIQLRAIAEKLDGEETRSREIHEPLAARRAESLQLASEALERCQPEEAAQFICSAAGSLLDDTGARLGEGSSPSPAAYIETLRLAREEIDALCRVAGSWKERLFHARGISRDERRAVRRSLRALERARRNSRRRELEAYVHRRLESAFGHVRVRRFENFILLLLFGLVALVVAEWRLPSELARFAGGDPVRHAFFQLVAHRTTYYLNIADLVICVFFQVDFFVRLACAGWSLGYFLRHFFLESLPAFPFGFFVHNLGLMGEARLVILARLFRLRTVLRMRGALLIVVRVFRLLVFAVRGLDRTVERFRLFLDRDVVLFETDPVHRDEEAPERRRALQLDERRQRTMRNTLLALAGPDRALLLHTQALAAGGELLAIRAVDLPYRPGVAGGKGEIHLERAIQHFLHCDTARAVGALGREGVERLARLLRIAGVPGLRRLPLLRRLAPAARLAAPAEAVTAAANELGRMLQDLLGALWFWGDLSGITTGPQILDRVGTAVVVASKRPAMRLVIFGALLLVLRGLATLVEGVPGFQFVSRAAEAVGRILGLPLLVLGGICFVFLLVGRWLKRIAGEALDMYLRTADAQFYQLLKVHKFLALREHVKALYRCVLRPECRLRCRERVSDEEWIEFLEEPLRVRARFLPRRPPPEDPRLRELAEDREAIALLYRDFLDGPVLHRSDDKTSVQLLGNLAFQDIRSQTLGLTTRELRRLERLDLEKGRIFAPGPYVWFRFITESLAIETAKLIMEYNTTCIPLAQLHLASAEARARLEYFLAEHRERVDSRERRLAASRRQLFGAPLTTPSFTAFDFLGATPESDEAVQRRYGDEVLEALRKDRRAVIRDIFGTRPYHLLPRTDRVVNPYRLYWKYLGGARVFLLPAFALLGLCRLAARGVSQVVALVQEVLGKRRVLRSHLSRTAGFDVAVRKINRMRKPFFIEALRLRAAVDVEYLDLPIPGQEHDPEAVTYRDDLNLIGALETERRPIEAMRARALRDLGTFRRLLDDPNWLGAGVEGLLSELDPSGGLAQRRGEVMRAIVTAYIADHGGLRSMITAPLETEEFFESALREGPLSPAERFESFLLSRLLWFLPRTRRRRRLFDAHLQATGRAAGLPAPVRRRLWWRFLKAGDEAERMFRLALQGLEPDATTGEDAVRTALARAAREHTLWTRKIVTVRTVQVLTVLDIEAYRRMVWEVGDYTRDARGGGKPVAARSS